MVNLRTIGDLKGEGNKDELKQNRQSYVGGEKSGLLVEDNNKSISEKILKMAQE